jgi:hypothetical protein
MRGRHDQWSDVRISRNVNQSIWKEVKVLDNKKSTYDVKAFCYSVSPAYVLERRRYGYTKYISRFKFMVLM